MRKLLLAISAITFLFIVGCEKKEPASSEANEIVIGVQGPETGEIAIYGLQTLYGAELAAKEINAAGGINGKPIKLVHYDSRGDKVEAVNVAKRLIDNDKVCGIIGEPTSGALSAIRGVANANKVIAISAGATALGVTDGLPYVFRNTLLDADGAPATIQFLKETKGWTKYGLITSTNNDYSVGLSETFRDAAKANDVLIIDEQSINDKDTNISAQVTAMKGKDFDAIIFTGYHQEAALILKELRKQGINVPLVGGDGFQSPELYNAAGDAALGSIFFAGFSTSSDDQIIKDFNSKIEQEGHSSDQFSAQGYDAMYLMAKAAKDANITNCADQKQREKMRDAMAVIVDFNGVSGNMSFDAEGNGVKKPFIQEVVKDDEGNYYFKLIN